MTVHTPDYPLFRFFMAFLSTSWARHVDFDVTEGEEVSGSDGGHQVLPEPELT